MFLRWMASAAAAWLIGLPVALAYEYKHDFDPADPATWPVVAVIIDDLGDRPILGRRALALPGPVACAILPRTPYASEFARTAFLRGKEVLLHQPLEAATKNELLGPGAITRQLTLPQMRSMLRTNLESIAYVSGVNNHMGSWLTTQTGAMNSLMAEIRANNNRFGGLFFVDSVTSGATVAQRAAAAARIPNARRDVFLDHVQDSEHVAQQLDLLKRTARQQGFALGIGHPFAVTLDALGQALPQLAANGYRLVSVRELIAVREARKPDHEVMAYAPRSGVTTHLQK